MRSIQWVLMKVTRIAYSHHVNPGKYAQLAEQAARLGRVRTPVWDRYGCGMPTTLLRSTSWTEQPIPTSACLPRTSGSNRSSRNGPIATGPDCRTRTPAPANAVAESELSKRMLTYEQGKEAGGYMESERVVWETPEFVEIGVAAEVTMYVARMED